VTLRVCLSLSVSHLLYSLGLCWFVCTSVGSNEHHFTAVTNCLYILSMHCAASDDKLSPGHTQTVDWRVTTAVTR